MPLRVGGKGEKNAMRILAGSLCAENLSGTAHSDGTERHGHFSQQRGPGGIAGKKDFHGDVRSRAVDRGEDVGPRHLLLPDVDGSAARQGCTEDTPGSSRRRRHPAAEQRALSQFAPRELENNVRGVPRGRPKPSFASRHRSDSPRVIVLCSRSNVVRSSVWRAGHAGSGLVEPVCCTSRCLRAGLVVICARRSRGGSASMFRIEVPEVLNADRAADFRRATGSERGVAQAQPARPIDHIVQGFGPGGQCKPERDNDQCDTFHEIAPAFHRDWVFGAPIKAGFAPATS